VHARRQAERATTQQDAAAVRTEEDSAPAPAVDVHSLPADLGQLVKLSKVRLIALLDSSGRSWMTGQTGLAGYMVVTAVLRC
jgi:hypothetical protein